MLWVVYLNRKEEEEEEEEEVRKGWEVGALGIKRKMNGSLTETAGTCERI